MIAEFTEDLVSQQFLNENNGMNVVLTRIHRRNDYNDDVNETNSRILTPSIMRCVTTAPSSTFVSFERKKNLEKKQLTIISDLSISALKI